MNLTITTIAAAVNAIWLLVLAWQVVDMRRTTHIHLGDDGNEQMMRRTRAMSNHVEYTPFALILLALAEFGGANVMFVAAIAAIYTLGRILHGYGMAFTENAPKLRFNGTLLTWISIAALSVYNLIIGFYAL